MYIERLDFRIRDIYKGFNDDGEGGVTALSGCLDVRPPFQREFIYDDAQQRRVIDTILHEYPLNVFYYGTTGITGRYQLIEGQQRTMSFCKFIKGDFSIPYNGAEMTFSGLPLDIQERILNYELLIYKCDGTDSEKLAWFETINIASEPLTSQELRNAVYTGTWLNDAKKYFSRTNCPAIQLGGNYIKGQPLRQEILEDVLQWVSNAQGIKITDYMDRHKNDTSATELWEYYNNVIKWVRSTFGDGFKDMRNVKWGILYNRYHEQHYVDEMGNIMCTVDGVELLHPKKALLEEVQRLQDDDEVTSRQGIYEYILSGDERKLSIRKFPDKIKAKKYRQQGNKCADCQRVFPYEDLVADHITPWSKGGKTVEGNCQLLCVECNSRKSNKSEIAVDEIACKKCGKAVKVGMFCQYCGTKN